MDIYLKECYLEKTNQFQALEVLKEIKELGSHHMFIAEVLSINANEEYIDEKGAFDITKCNLVAYANGKYFSLGDNLGKFGFSVKK